MNEGKLSLDVGIGDYLNTPLYSDVFQWFNETGLTNYIFATNNGQNWHYHIEYNTHIINSKPYQNLRQARRACLNTLIKIVKSLINK